MEIKDARLLMKSLDALVEQLNLPFYVAEHFCDAEIKDAVFAAFANLIREVDYEIVPKLIARYPELKEDMTLRSRN
ncbi:hypothetical protein ACVILH_001605 [Bradyrhizobium sp. USDA 4353]